MLINRLGLIGSYVKQASIRVQFGVHFMRSSCILSKYNLYKGQSEALIVPSSSVDGFYANWHRYFVPMTAGWGDNFRKFGVNNLHRLYHQAQEPLTAGWGDNFRKFGLNSLHRLYHQAQETPHAAQCSSCQQRYNAYVLIRNVDHYLTGQHVIMNPLWNPVRRFTWKNASLFIWQRAPNFSQGHVFSSTTTFCTSHDNCVIAWRTIFWIHGSALRSDCLASTFSWPEPTWFSLNRTQERKRLRYGRTRLWRPYQTLEAKLDDWFVQGAQICVSVKRVCGLQEECLCSSFEELRRNACRVPSI
jgi:hypothetical protein